MGKDGEIDTGCGSTIFSVSQPPLCICLTFKQFFLFVHFSVAQSDVSLVDEFVSTVWT